VLGFVERQRFDDPADPSSDGAHHPLAEQLRRLRELRDRPETWELRVDERGLGEAVAARRILSEGDRIVASEHLERSHAEPEFVHALKAEIANCEEIRAEFAQGNYMSFETAETVWGPIESALNWATRVEGLLREKAPQWFPDFPTRRVRDSERAGAGLVHGRAGGGDAGGAGASSRPDHQGSTVSGGSRHRFRG
jgi:hypothetical protein